MPGTDLGTVVKKRGTMFDREPENFPDVRRCGICGKPVRRLEAVIDERIEKEHLNLSGFVGGCLMGKDLFGLAQALKIGGWYHAQCLRSDTLFPELVASGAFDPLPTDAEMTFPYYINRIDDRPDYWDTERGRLEIASGGW